MKRVWFWVWDHWYLVVLAIGLGIAMLWSRSASPASVIERLKLELEAIKAKGQARQARTMLGSVGAREQVEIAYRSEIIALDASQKRTADALREDPVALAQFLVRAGARKRP